MKVFTKFIITFIINHNFTRRSITMSLGIFTEPELFLFLFFFSFILLISRLSCSANMPFPFGCYVF